MPLVTRVPAEAFHPSIFIKEELEARKWTVDDLVRRMPGEYGVNYLAVDMYLEIGPDEPNARLNEMATEISAAFGVSPELFANLERAWVEHPTTQAAMAAPRSCHGNDGVLK